MLRETYYMLLFYSLYDVNHDGYITRSEMFAVISAIYNLMGDSDNVADRCPELHVNKIFKVHKLPIHKLPIHLYITLGMT
jgi:Ca2+-binding EF-hand superfamily protein